MSSINRYKNIITILFSLIIALTITIIYTSMSLLDEVGPTSLSKTQTNKIIISLNDQFVIASNNGEIERQVKFSSINIKGLVFDIQTLMSGQHIIGDSGNQSLIKCSPFFLSCRPLTNKTDPDFYNIGRFHKFYIDEENQEIVLSNTEKHELVLLDMSGKLKRKLLTKQDNLTFPDGVYNLSKKQMLLSNSVNNEILHIDYSTPDVTVIKKHGIKSKISFKNRNLPIAVTHTPNNKWWVIAQASSLTGIGSSIYIYNNNWKAINQLNHSEFIHPVDFISINESMLIADMHGYSIKQFSFDGKYIADFGERGLNVLFDQIKSSKQFKTTLKHSSIFLLITLLVLALIIDKKQKQEAALQELPSNTDNIKLYSISFSTNMVMAMRIIIIIVVIMLLISGFLLYQSIPELITEVAPVPILLCFIFFISAYLFSKHTLKQIKIDDNTLSITKSNGSTESTNITSIYYSDSILWINNSYYLIGAHGSLMKNNTSYEKLLKSLEVAERIKNIKMQFKMFKKELLPNLGIIILLLSIFLYSTTLKTNDNIKKEHQTLQKLMLQP